MSKEGDKASVFKTTKVRTKLKGDNSWLQRSSQPQPEEDDEKPWIAEVRANRLNGANVETSPVSSPIQSSPSPLKTSTVRSPTSGFLIRGVFTKTEKTPTTSNDSNGTTQFTKKPSETYKKIALHTVKNITESQEGQLSQEEQEKRTEAASNVLKKPVKQRSYVLSAAKLYETKDKTPDLLVNSTASFVAQRVEITDDEESNATSPTTTTVTNVTPPPKPRTSVTTRSSQEIMGEVKTEEVKEKEKDLFENMAPGCTKVATPLPELVPDLVQVTYVKPDEKPESLVLQKTPPSPPAPAPPQTATVSSIVVTTKETVEAEPAKKLVKISSDNNEPVIPTSIPKRIEVKEPLPLVKVEPLKTPEVKAEQKLQPKVELNTKTLLKPQAEPVLNLVEIKQTKINLKEKEPEQLVDIVKVQKEAKTETQTKVEPKKDLVEIEPTQKRIEVKEPLPLVKVEPLKTPEVKAEQKLQPKVEPNTKTLLKPQAEPVLNLVEIKQTKINLKEKEPEQLVDIVKVQKEVKTETQTKVELKKDLVKIEPTQKSIVEQQSTNTISNVEPLTDDLLGFNNSPELVPLVPPSFGSWSQDLLSPIESEKPEPVKPRTSLVDLLSNEDIVVTEVHSLSTLPKEKKQTETQSVTETVTITTKTVIITDEREEESADPPSSHMITTVTESSSTDPFDPYPIGTTSSNSTSDLLQPLADISISSASDTSVRTKAPSPETNMSGNLLDSLSDDIIPFNKEAPSSLSTRLWTRTWEPMQPESTKKSQEPAKAEESQVEDEQTVIMFERKSNENDSPWDRWTSPTVYTIRTNEEEDEEEESNMPEDSETQIISTVTTIRETYSEPEPSMDLTSTESDGESKKPFVYVKEYVNTSELSLLNAKDTDSDYLTSSSSSYSYSSPSTYLSASTKCTFCGEQVGSDTKITIEHLKINCHPDCFKCGVCGIPMGDFLHKMFLHGGIVHCESCYRNA